MENMETVITKTDEKKEIQTVETDWQESRRNEIISRLLAGENLQTIMDSFPGFRESFHELDTLDCSDGRVLEGRKMGIAGSGLLLPPEERAKFVKNYQGKIKEVTTHRDCGAAAVKFAEVRALFPETIPAHVQTADDYGTWCGQQMAADLGAKHVFLDMNQMVSADHNETAIVLDQTGHFDSTNLESFPPHFVCSGAGLGFSQEYMKSEMETLAGIALGSHGYYGNHFSVQNPFYIMVVAKNPIEENIWENIAKEVAQKFAGRIAVKSVVAPEFIEPEN